jgi:DNA (cytosine-5)-methyltransferase 1
MYIAKKSCNKDKKDGLLDKCPIFGDINEFIEEGFAEIYQGVTDIITAGFPCQPFSVAGKQKGKNDERNMWPATLRTIEIVQPKYVFLENVPGLLSSGYFQDILCGLFEIGYNAKWTVLGASDVGASHKRKRLWILAYAYF